MDLITVGLKPFYSFDQLVIGPNNHVAAAACQAVVKSLGEIYNPLFLYGPAGVGKTHLMQAVAHELIKKNPGAKIKYISAERFMSEIVAAITEDRLAPMREQYSQLDLLIVDDVQYLSESKVSQEELFHIFNNLHQSNRQVILAADRPPNQLTALNKNIRSRLEWGLASDVKIPDMPTRVEILKRKQSVQGLQMDEAMLLYVAQMLCSNVRELEGFLKRIHAYMTLSHQTITMELVKSVVHEVLPDADATNGSSVGIAKNGNSPNGYAAHPAPVKEAPSPLKSPAPIPVPAHLVTAPPAPAAPAPVAAAAPPSAASPAVAAPKEPAPFSIPPLPSSPSTPEEAAAVLIPSLPASPPSKNGQPQNENGVAVAGVPEPAAAAEPVLLPVEEAPVDEELPSGHKEVSAVFFYPAGGEPALESVAQKFQDVIKKHKLKFRLKRVHNEPYETKGKVNFNSFVDACKANKVPVAIVIGPPPDAVMQQQDFYDLLSVTLDVQGISLQLVNWGEINKDYRYLNLALDIALVRSR